MRSSFTSVMALVGILISMHPAVAQTTAPAPPADAMQVARELVVVTHATERMRALLPQIMQQLKPAIVQNRPAVERDYDAVVGAAVDVALARIDDLADAIAVIYARNFGVQELRDILAFYHTPTGEKLLEKMPAITQESLVAGQKFGQSVVPQMQQRIIQELRKKGHDI
jgi:uncharacterized protein